MNLRTARHAPVSAGVIERMRRDIDFQLLPDGQSFEVSYRSPDPHVAQKVAARLARLYIQDSLHDRAVSCRILGTRSSTRKSTTSGRGC